MWQDFIGSPQMNFFDVTVDNGTVRFGDGSTMTLSEGMLKKTERTQGRDGAGIRGEDIKMDAQNMELNNANASTP